MAVGTPGYMAPEQVLGKAVDARADIYAYAAMVFRALTGRLPYTGDSSMEIAIATVRSPIPSATALRNDLPDELDQFMLRALAKEPADRPQTMAELVALLNKVPQRRVTPSRVTPAPAFPAAPAPPASATPQPSLSFARLQAAMAAAPPATVGSAVAALELRGTPRLVARESLALDAYFANLVTAGRQVCGPRWAEVVGASGLQHYLTADPPPDDRRGIPIEDASHLNEAFEIVFGAETPDQVRQWGRVAADRWLKARGSGEQAAIKLALGRHRKLDLLLKSHVRTMDKVRGEHLHAFRQIDDRQVWLVHYLNLFAFGRRKPDKACHFWTASLEAMLRWAGLANDWLVTELECGCVNGSFDCVFAIRSVRN